MIKTHIMVSHKTMAQAMAIWWGGTNEIEPYLNTVNKMAQRSELVGQRLALYNCHCYPVSGGLWRIQSNNIGSVVYLCQTLLRYTKESKRL